MTTLTPSQIQRMVAETLGWTPSQGLTKKLWRNPNGRFLHAKPPRFHKSLDACHNAFEKDAPEEYWMELAALIFGLKVPSWTLIQCDWIAVARATPLQRCEAWLRYKGVIK